MLTPLVVIVGPTAVGKSKIAVEVAGKIDGEIVSADSMQVYRFMDIGTAKTRETERYTGDGKYIPHHLLDFKDPKESFSVAEFQKLAREKIEEIYRRGKLPMLVGGTGLYVRSVIDPYTFTELEVDWEIRRRLKKQAAERGNLWLHRQLAEVDPVSAAKIHPNDLRRVIRALEVYYRTGQPLSKSHRVGREENKNYRVCMIGLYMDRKKLYQRINQRVDEMIATGLVEEVRKLLEMGYSPQLPALQGLGYKQIVGYLKGEYSLEEAIRLLKRDTRRFAKRQLTWFRRDKRIRWFDVDVYSNIQPLVELIVGEIRRTLSL
ncbi:tRNA (adenosine(37)-N6)-dimethylallyltransferase MiaA [Calderihabitans maritimus]|uniref:tRNA dimethylallyltransferase n=1 Tax=Calderihabitans maritimus TaxID=1246530 RepID=A0A1Z5HPP6_9FIRM|nr:tRNA (adenosine(37)-N6)-dimethylallyltransferase MiaA [Calderihabitans maritimus]GAW91493.1 tRNA dimethylallyltransferase [Calderihabitans maritimus]